MAEGDTYAVVKKLNRQDKVATKETKKRKNEGYEAELNYELVGMPFPSSGAISLNENTKGYAAEPNYAVVGKNHPSSEVNSLKGNTKDPKIEAEPSYAVVGSHFSSSGIKTQAQNAKGPGHEEEPNYVLAGSNLQSSGVADTMENSKALASQEDLLKNGKQPKLLIAFIITVIILLSVIIALIIWNLQLIKQLSQSVPINATREEELQQCNVSLTQLIQNIEPVCQGNLTSVTIPDPQLLKHLNQAVHIQATREKEMQQCKVSFSQLTQNVECACQRNSLSSSNKKKEQLFDFLSLCGTTFNKSYYFFSNSSLSWDESQQWCKFWGSDLVVINTRDEQQFLQNNTKQDDFWIGLTDVAEEGKWKWVDGTICNHKSNDKMYFFDNEPDNYTDTKRMDEDCAYMRSSDGKWGDARCSDKKNWICEKQANTCHL